MYNAGKMAAHTLAIQLYKLARQIVFVLNFIECQLSPQSLVVIPNIDIE